MSAARPNHRCCCSGLSALAGRLLAGAVVAATVLSAGVLPAPVLAGIRPLPNALAVPPVVPEAMPLLPQEGGWVDPGEIAGIDWDERTPAPATVGMVGGRSYTAIGADSSAERQAPVVGFRQGERCRVRFSTMTAYAVGVSCQTD